MGARKSTPTSGSSPPDGAAVASTRIELARTGVSKGDLFLMLDLYGLRHLLALPANATVQVMKQQTTWHAGLNGAFTIMQFEDHAPAVFVETMAGDVSIDGEGDIETFVLGFDYLRAAAASVEESRALILRATIEL